MKKNVFVALFLAVVMVVSCAVAVFTTSAVEIKANSGKYAAYVSAAVVPTVDGKADELAWGSTNAVNGVKVLWGDTGLYFMTETLDGTIEYSEDGSDAAKVTLTLAGGAVSGGPEGTKAAKGTAVEIYVPYTVYTESYAGYHYYGFKQEATNRDNTVKDTVTITGTDKTFTKQTASPADAVDCKWITRASDIIGTSMKLGAETLEYAGPYGYSNTCNGYTDDFKYDNDQITGQSEVRSYRVNADFPAEPGYATMVDGDTFVITSYTSYGDPCPRYGYLPLQIVYAAYAPSDRVPVIDGVIDNVWSTTAKFYHENEIDNEAKDAYGYVSIIWSDDGLYYLGVVRDIDIVTFGNSDICNFFCTETYCKGETDAPDSFPAVAGENKYGAYWFGIGPVGNVRGLNAALTDYTFAGSLQTVDVGRGSEAGYVVEAFVPYINADVAKVGHIMGMASSIDNYTDVEQGVGGRDEYTNLGGLSSYWSNPQSEFQVVFVGNYDFARDNLTYDAVNTIVNAALAQYVKTEDALNGDAVQMLIDDSVDAAVEELNASIDELKASVEALQAGPDLSAALADYAKTADLADYAKKSDIPSLDDYAKKSDISAGTNYTPVIVVLFVLSIAGVALGVVAFLKKK